MKRDLQFKKVVKLNAGRALDVVSNFDKYAEFVPGCTGASLISRNPPIEIGRLEFQILGKKMCGSACPCRPKNWGAGACTSHYENVLDICAGAEKKSAHTKGLVFPPKIDEIYKKSLVTGQI